MFRRSSCSVCERLLEDGESVYRINEEYICESCIDTFHETYFDADPEGEKIDMKTDEMIERRLNNG